jgi:hypothetical protein
MGSHRVDPGNARHAHAQTGGSNIVAEDEGEVQHAGQNSRRDTNDDTGAQVAFAEGLQVCAARSLIACAVRR